MLHLFHRNLQAWAHKENLYKHFWVSRRSPNTITHWGMLGNTKPNLIYYPHMHFIYYCDIKVQKNVFFQTLFIETEMEVKEPTQGNAEPSGRGPCASGMLCPRPLRSGVFVSTTWACTGHRNKNNSTLHWEGGGNLYKEGLVQRKPVPYL